MKIGIIGAGRVGQGLASVWSASGHEVVLSFARDRAALESSAAAVGASADEPAAAVSGADVVLLAAPWSAMDEALAAAGDLTGTVVIDATNALGAGLDGPAAQELADRIPGARVVKAFNTVFAQLFAAARAEPTPPSLVLCGDDPEAIRIAAGLASDAGFAPIDVGGLEQAGDVEAFARLVIGLAYREGHGPFYYRLGVSPSARDDQEASP